MVFWGKILVPGSKMAFSAVFALERKPEIIAKSLQPFDETRQFFGLASSDTCK